MIKLDMRSLERLVMLVRITRKLAIELSGIKDWMYERERFSKQDARSLVNYGIPADNVYVVYRKDRDGKVH